VNAATRVLSIAGPILYFLLVHVAVMLQRPLLVLAALALFAAINLALAALRKGRPAALIVWASLCAVFVTLALVGYFAYPGIASIVLVPPVLVNGFLLYIFGVSLLPGREPLIARFRRLVKGEAPAESLIYMRRLTLAWALLFLVMTAAAIMFAAFSDVGNMTVWSWTVNIVGPALGVGFFIGEHLLRPKRFGGPSSPFSTLRVIMLPSSWVGPRAEAPAHDRR